MRGGGGGSVFYVRWDYVLSLKAVAVGDSLVWFVCTSKETEKQREDEWTT